VLRGRKTARAGFRLLNLEKGIAKKMAKRTEGQVIENKRFHEIADSAPSMISMTCGARCETFGFVWRNESFRFRDFGLVSARNETGVARRDGGYAPESARPRTRSLGEAEGAKEVAQKST
jgi:hypothetical protein